jgi:hypothetical protein
VGVARMLQSSERGEKGEALGYAIQISDDILALLSELVTPCEVAVVGGAEPSVDPLRSAPDPRPESIKSDDIQKNRWGGKSSGWGYELTVENVELHSRYSLFDAVLEKKESGEPPEGPFIFHLHDSYPKSVIWIRKVRGTKAALEQIHASGTYTLGVQFKDATHNLRSLEYDLAGYGNGVLEKYDR